jgi:hypothetical protein
MSAATTETGWGCAVPEVDITTHGAEKLVRLAKAISTAGDKELGRKLTKALQQADKPLKKSARQGALQILPYRGGLAERVAKSRFTSRITKSGSGAGLTITGTGQDNLSRMDAGTVRHPVYGNRDQWVTQRIAPGWFTNPLTLDAPKVREELDKAIDELSAELEAGGG